MATKQSCAGALIDAHEDGIVQGVIEVWADNP